LNEHPTDTTDDDEDDAPGWSAIDASLAALYGDQEPQHMGTVLSYQLGGRDPLDGISAYYREHPVPHWHYVTYGFSELYDKEQEDENVSGFGFELTFRLRTATGATEAPTWVFSLLQNLARYVFKTGNAFKPGETMPANGPIALDTDTRIWSMAMTSDPELPALQTPNGHLEFIQVVGLTVEEASAATQWSAQHLLDTLLPHMPLWIPFGRPFMLAGGDLLLLIEPGDTSAVIKDGDGVVITMTPTCARDFADTMRAQAGRYQLAQLPTVSWIVQQTHIRDADGNIVSTVG